ncbi:MAG: YihA family ribosome biogenesis GTP-binding protein [Parcubacteria group bacterium]|nr:YihA family ribosome biogenesis GTP-binding protein [Parcubacteria group bacterium]
MKKINIKSAEFIKGIIGTDKILEDTKAQIAFVGRSNVGKSSVINSLVNRKNLVKSSSKPGRTRQINFFLINERVYFVDLPGYGFMKIDMEKKEKIRKLMIWYLSYSEVKLKKAVLIIDAKVGPTEFDMEMLDLLKKSQHKVIIIANKTDKLKKKQVNRQLEMIQKKISDNNVILYSAKTKQGRDELLNRIFEN